MTAPAEPMLAPTSWAQAPRPPARRHGLGVLVTELLALTVALIGPFARSQALWHSRGQLIAAIVTISSLIIGRVPARLWAVRLLVAALAGAVLYRPEGMLLAVWVPGALVLADWAVRRRPPLPFLPTPGLGAVGPAVGLSLLAALVGSKEHATFGPLIVQALVVVPTLLSSGHGRAARILEHLPARVGAAVGAVVSTITFGLLGLVMVVPPWLVHRITRVDPLAWPTRQRRGWTERTRDEPRPTQAWAPEASVRRPSLGLRMREAAPAVVLVAAIILAVRGPDLSTPGQTQATPPPPRPPGTPAAYKGLSWYKDYLLDTGWVTNDKVAWRPMRPYRLVDARSRTVNVIDGLRKTWTPPRCASCKTVTVWIYGGSTTWGVGQRDDHTIASELARIASRDGVRVVVENRGQLGQLHWEEANRLSWDLSVSPKPDLVLFYDGVNEIWDASILDANGTGDVKQPHDPTIDGLEKQLDGLKELDHPPPPAPPGARLDPPPKPVAPNAKRIAKLALKRYERSREMSKQIGEAYDIPIVYFWQPSRYSRPPIKGEPRDPEPGETTTRKAYEYAEQHIPDGVIDLARSFDDMEQPLFSDAVHHNEVGARRIAQRMYAAIEARLEALA